MTYVFKDDEEYSVEYSASGDNAYYIPSCKSVGHRPNYASCLKRISNWIQKTGVADGACESQFECGTCPAQVMRREEMAAGKSIYFVNRLKLNSYYAEVTRASAEKFGGSQETRAEKRKKTAPPESASHNGFKQEKPQPQYVHKPIAVKPEHFLDMEQGSYADAINTGVSQAEVEVPIVAVPRVADQPLKEGMSLIEIARLRMANKAV